jgi:hypothetical protein
MKSISGRKKQYLLRPIHPVVDLFFLRFSAWACYGRMMQYPGSYHVLFLLAITSSNIFFNNQQVDVDIPLLEGSSAGTLTASVIQAEAQDDVAKNSNNFAMSSNSHEAHVKTCVNPFFGTFLRGGGWVYCNLSD